MDPLKSGKEKKHWRRAEKYCSCCSKDVTKPVKLFNMPLLKLAAECYTGASVFNDKPLCFIYNYDWNVFMEI